MEENKPTQMKVAMNYGAILGLALVALGILFYLTGWNRSMTSGLQWINYLVQILLIVMGIKYYRDSVQGGFISYGRALGTGTLISLFAAIIISVYMYIYITYMDPTFMEFIASQQEEQLYAQGFSDEQVERSMEMARNFTSPNMMLIMAFLGTTFIGFIMSLIISIFLKKENKLAEI